MRDAVAGQRAIVVGAAVLLGLVGVGAPLATSASSTPYDGARIACSVTTRLNIDVKGSGFPLKAPVKVSFTSLGRVVASASTTTSSTGTFAALLLVPSTVLSGDVTATSISGGAVVKASCSVKLRL